MTLILSPLLQIKTIIMWEHLLLTTKKFDPKEWKFKQESFILDYRDNMVLESNMCEVQDISDKVKDIFKDKTEQELYEYLFSYGFLVGCSWMSFKLIILDKKQKIPKHTQHHLER